MKRTKLTFLITLLLGFTEIQAEPYVMSLDSCRRLAVENNKELRMADMQIQTAYYNSKSAYTAYLPKVSATGMYMHTGRELSLLSDDQQASLSHLGDALSNPALNSVGEGLVDALRTDTRNMAGAALILTQPVYMGGKIRAYNNITRYAEEIAADRRDIQYQDLVVSVDETYWNIVLLSSRRKLAESYLNLVKTLDGDVSQLIAEGFATKADGLSVKVKVNEANVALIQVDNGIEILKMKLCQLCGIPLDTPIVLADENSDGHPGIVEDDVLDSTAWKDRSELLALDKSIRIYDEKVKVARSEFLPTVALTAGYTASCPSVFNSFEKKFKGTWNIGVAVNVPIVTWGDRGYKVKAAQAEAQAARLRFDETREKIELQVSQNRQKVHEARQRYSASLSSQEEADENLRYANVGYSEGVIPLSNVLEAQTAWLSAKTNLISSEIDLRLSYLYLKKSLGQIK